MSRNLKMRKIKIVLCISSDIDKVEHTGTTGGQNGGYSYSLSESEK